MTAFDTAWDLMKMPVIPESIVWGKDRIDARYLDGKTGEEMPINVRYTDDEYARLAGLIGTNENPLASMRAWSAGGDAYTASEAYTDTERRRRGYAKELYDFVARYLDEAGAYLLPDETQSHEMSEMWRKYAPDGIWSSIRMEEGQSVKKAINGKSISYYMTFDKIAEVEKAMGWESFGNWHNILTNDNELLLWLEEKAQTDKYGPKYKEMMQKVLHSYMNDYDKGSMVLEEGLE